MARVVDTSPTFEDFAAAAALESPFMREQMWRDRYEGVHREVFAAFPGGRGTASRPTRLIRELARVREQARDGARVLREVIEVVEPAVRAVLGVPATPAPVHVLLVGDGSVNASVGRLGDEVAVFHCLEWFRSADASSLLAAHEDAHAWHEIALGAAPPEGDLAWVTFSEGLATLASQEVVPGRPECDYYWYGHPGFGGWLSWCRDHREQLRIALRDRLDDPTAVDTFFGAQTFEERRRVGYFAAADLLTTLNRPLAELVRLPVTEARDLVRAALGAT